MTRRIAFLGGYTAGHVFPMLTVADAYRARWPDTQCLFVGSADGPEAALVPARGHDFVAIDGAPLHGATTFGARLAAYRALARGFRQARAPMRRARLDLALGFGGFISAGAMLAARTLGIATAIYEPNIVPGMANRRLAPLVDLRLVASAATLARRGWADAAVVGYPVRPEITSAAARRPGGDTARILVTAGSLGSQFLNRACPPLLGALRRRGVAVEVLHQSGAAERAAVADAYRGEAVPATVTGFIADMAGAYRDTDFVISGAGAGTLAEIAQCGLPSLIVPISGLADDHQAANAEDFARRTGAAWLCEADWQAPAVLSLVEERFHEPAPARARAADDGAAASIVAQCERVIGRARRARPMDSPAVPETLRARW